MVILVGVIWEKSPGSTTKRVGKQEGRELIMGALSELPPGSLVAHPLEVTESQG